MYNINQKDVEYSFRMEDPPNRSYDIV